MTLDLLTPERQPGEVALDPAVIEAARDGAWFVFSLSGGKDSGAMVVAANAWLDSVGHPRDRRLCLHADLGRSEWRSTPETVERTAAFVGLPLDVVSRGAGDMIARWEQRFINAKARYADLLIYHMIGPWSQPNKRFCQSELKVQVMGPHLARKLKGQRIIQVVGIRRDESHNRKRTEVYVPDARFAKPGNRAGTVMGVWHPLVDWSTPEVFAYHEAHGIPLHEGYTVYGSSRLSCAYCIMSSEADKKASASAEQNHWLYRHQVEMEIDSGYSFQMGSWLADTAPHLLSADQLHRLAQTKAWAEERARIEAAMPTRHRFVKGWPEHLPTIGEAREIAFARAVICDHYGIENHYPDAPAVQNRFQELLDLKALKLAA